MVLLARLLSQAFGNDVQQWRQVIVAMALISVAVGAFAGLAQSNLKRLWAYSSIATIGYALVGLAAGGQNGVHSMLMFMTLYVVDVTGFFACLTVLSRNGKALEKFEDFAGLFQERPGIALALTVFSLSALGIPGFSGFWGKFYVFKTALHYGMIPAAVIALVGSVVAAFYYLRLIKVMWFDPSPGASDAPEIEGRIVAYACALFSFPLVMFAINALDHAVRHASIALTQR